MRWDLPPWQLFSSLYLSISPSLMRVMVYTRKYMIPSGFAVDLANVSAPTFTHCKNILVHRPTVVNGNDEMAPDFAKSVDYYRLGSISGLAQSWTRAFPVKHLSVAYLEKPPQPLILQ